jgi:hypothetical protein
MRGYLRHIGLKLRYNPAPGILLDSVSKLGLELTPFYLYREGEADLELPQLEGAANYRVEILDEAELPTLAAFPARQPTLQDLRQRLLQGMLCLGLRHRGEVVAFVWCDLGNCHYPGCRFSLQADEAYLFDQYTLMSYRGKRIAPYLRARAYQLLAERGLTRLFSVSNRYNANANRFKQKLRARVVHTGIHVKVLGRWDWASPLAESRLRQIRSI